MARISSVIACTSRIIFSVNALTPFLGAVPLMKRNLSGVPEPSLPNIIPKNQKNRATGRLRLPGQKFHRLPEALRRSSHDRRGRR